MPILGEADCTGMEERLMASTGNTLLGIQPARLFRCVHFVFQYLLWNMSECEVGSPMA